jgi:hypothetical protein
MHAIGIAQGHPPNANVPSEETFFFTRDEKIEIADAFGANEHPEVYLVEEHAGGEHFMGSSAGTLSYEQARASKNKGHFEIPLNKRLGRVTEVMVDKHSNLHPVVQFFHENPRTREIQADINSGRKKYGFSVGVDAERLPGKVQNKRWSHLGLTTNPEYGGDPNLTFDPAEPGVFGTWLHQAAVSYDGIDDIIAERYLSDPDMYAAKRTRDRVAARPKRAAPKAVSVGATRSPTDPTSHILSAQGTPAAFAPAPPAPIAPMSAPPQLSTSVSSSLEGHLNAPMVRDESFADPAIQQSLARQAAQTQQAQGGPTAADAAAAQAARVERLRRAELELEKLHAGSEEVINKLDLTDSSKIASAKELQKLFEDLMVETGAFADSSKRARYSPSLFKLDNYVKEATRLCSTHIDQMDLSETERRVFKEMIAEPDVRKYGPVLAQVGASAKSFNNMRLAQQQLDKEVEQRKQAELQIKQKDDELETFRKRAREFEETANSLAKRTGFVGSSNYTTPVSPASPAPVPVSAGGSRFLGSSLTTLEHSRPDMTWSDFAPSRVAYQTSAASRSTFDDMAYASLKNVSALAEKYMNYAPTKIVDGVIGNL